MYREGLAAALRASRHVEVVDTVAQPPADLAALRADVVLFDASQPASLQAVRELLRGAHAARIVVVGVADDEAELLAFAEAGVAGYVTSEQPIDDVVGAVRAVACDEMICTPRMAASLLRHVATLAAGLSTSPVSAYAPLTPRESEIVGLIDRGMSNKQIALALQIEVGTVKNHVHNILEKLRVQRRGEAAAQVRHGLVRPMI
jgi:DNA-binding NarL/FixJ family response regulator